jgi:hypothetical protein
MRVFITVSELGDIQACVTNAPLAIIVEIGVRVSELIVLYSTPLFYVVSNGAV